YSGRALKEKGMRFDLGAYQCHVFLDWKHLRDDVHHPWRELQEHLRGRGVPSLADAMRDLQLKPVHDALYSIVNLSLIRQRLTMEYKASCTGLSCRSRIASARLGTPRPRRCSCSSRHGWWTSSRRCFQSRNT